MKFTIENIGKIKKANLDLRGITVIVGDNNTGKSTVGRTLYTFFNALFQIDSEVDIQRKKQVYRLARQFLEKYRRVHSPVSLNRLNALLEDFLDGSTSDMCSLKEYLLRVCQPRATTEDVDRCLMSVVKVRGFSKTEIRRQIIENHFDLIFSHQYLRYGAESGQVYAKIEGHSVAITLKNEKISYDSDINIQQRAYFIDNPDLLNDLNGMGLFDLWGGWRSPIDSAIIKAISARVSGDWRGEETPADSAFDDLQFAQRYEKFLTEISAITGGNFLFNSDHELRFVEGGSKEKNSNREEEVPSFALTNVSEGLKAFGVIELLLRHKVLQEGDILILDEPEVHLHPEWQMKYAKLIVALQKAFSLRVLVTTHSSQFLMALRLYCEEDGRRDCVNAYRVNYNADEHSSTIESCEDDKGWDDAYVSFLSAANEMSDLNEKVYGRGDAHD